jgi:hypothetical protein
LSGFKKLVFTRKAFATKNLRLTPTSTRISTAGQISAGLPSSLRGALATKQSSFLVVERKLDCFASLAMTVV